MMRMSSSGAPPHEAALRLALFEEDDGKRAGSVTEPDNSFVYEAARKKTVIYFAVKCCCMHLSFYLISQFS